MDWHTRINQITEEMDRKYAEESVVEIPLEPGVVYHHDPTKERLQFVSRPKVEDVEAWQSCGVWVCNVGEPCDVA